MTPGGSRRHPLIVQGEDMAHNRIPRNAFHRTLVGLNYGGSPLCEPDLFSCACVEAYETSNQRQFGYQFTQIFEPGVLQEVALLEGVPVEAMETLDHRPTAAMEDLRQRLDGRRDLSVVERINLASALISVSRFGAAEHARPEAVGTAQERFELAWIDFLISNRRDDGLVSRDAFSRMMAAVNEGSIPPGRIVDACTQGIVWYLKRREIDHAQYRWCVENGSNLIRAGAVLGSATISSWYRGLAMVPAAGHDAERTRRYMAHAYDHAAQAAYAPDSHGALNALKTYYESCIKEFMYVRPDLGLAEHAGLALIAMDKQWSSSYAELADAYERFGQLEKAADYYEKAVAAGPPYVGHHLVSAARARANLDDTEGALRHYLTLSELAPTPNTEICREALDLATRSGHALRDYFRNAVDRGQPLENGA